MNGIKYMFLLLVIGGLFSSCADVSEHVSKCVTNTACGFWHGLWHGMILPISWIISLFDSDVAIYAYNNTGGWYDFGFVLGVGALTSSSSSTVSRK